MTETPSSRVVITVLGKNRPGIVAGVTRILSEANVDIRDITQSIIEDIFTMTLLADVSSATLDFTQLQEELVSAGETLGVTVEMQREDVFQFMYRLSRHVPRDGFAPSVGLLRQTRSARPGRVPGRSSKKEPHVLRRA